jgi:hypothetical protein
MIRYLITIIAGILFGLLCGWVLVDFPPQWFNHLHPVLKLLFSILPILASFLFAMLIFWWDYKIIIIFSSIVVVLSFVGSILNENANACGCSDGINFIDIVIVFIMFIAFISFFIIIGEFGRWCRRFIRRSSDKIK